MNDRKTVIIADDHEISRAGTKQILQTIDDVELVAEAADGLAAIKAVRVNQPDLLLLDAAMPLARGIEVFTETRRWSPSTGVIVMTGFNSPGFVADWINAGVDGFLLKSCKTDEIHKGICVVVSGGQFICAEAAKILQDTDEPVALTDREREVMALVLLGQTNAEIADKLSISIKTVDKHRGSLMSKLGVHSVAELMAYAFREGMLDELKQL